MKWVFVDLCDVKNTALLEGRIFFFKWAGIFCHVVVYGTSPEVSSSVNSAVNREDVCLIGSGANGETVTITRSVIKIYRQYLGGSLLLRTYTVKQSNRIHYGAMQLSTTQDNTTHSDLI